jgi:hypothetical protein
MTSRTTLTMTEQMARTMIMRGTARSFDDKHLISQVEKCDTVKGETKTNFEFFQPVGMTAVPLRQAQDNQKAKAAKKPSGDANERGNDLDDDQPTGKAAEALVFHVMGQYSHPVAMFDDRRVRPFNMKEGESAYYSASGTGQMLIHTAKGSYMVVVNNPAEQAESQDEVERVASLRHVTKDKQKRDLKKGEEPEEHVHEGKPDQVDTEVRASKDKIELLDGQTVVAVYNKADKSWTFSNFDKLNLNPTNEFNITTKKIVMTATDDKFDINGKPINFNGGGPTVPPFTVPG